MAWTSEDRRNHCRQIGMKGGMATKAKYCGVSGQTGYYSAIGKLGFDSYAKKYHDGNRAKAVEALKRLTSPNRNSVQPGAFR